jgi:hypothetical protein
MKHTTQLIGLSTLTVVGHNDSHEGGLATIDWSLSIIERKWGIKSMDVRIDSVWARLKFWDEEKDIEYEEEGDFSDWDIDIFFYVSQGSIFPGGIIFDFNVKTITLEF